MYNTPGDPDYIGYTGDVAPATGNWWEGPRPAYVPATAPWPPPLPPGASYGPNVGQIIYAPGTEPTNPQQPQPGVDTPVTVDQPHYYPKPPGTEDPVTTPLPPGPGPTPGPGLGPLLQPWGGTYTPPAPVNLGGQTGIEYIPPVPTFTPPTFEMPTAEDVYADPSYKLRKQEGEDGLVNSAAAKGLVRSGGDLSDILKYNQGFASNEYGNVVDRKFRKFATDYQGAADAFAPQLDQWRTQGQAGQRQNELNNDQAWAQYLERYREWDDQRKFTYGSLSDQQRIGIDAATR